MKTCVPVLARRGRAAGASGPGPLGMVTARGLVVAGRSAAGGDVASASGFLDGSSHSPQYRHLTATAWICSPQKGQVFMGYAPPDGPSGRVLDAPTFAGTVPQFDEEGA